MQAKLKAKELERAALEAQTRAAEEEKAKKEAIEAFNRARVVQEEVSSLQTNESEFGKTKESASAGTVAIKVKETKFYPSMI